MRHTIFTLVLFLSFCFFNEASAQTKVLKDPTASQRLSTIFEEQSCDTVYVFMDDKALGLVIDMMKRYERSVKARSTHLKPTYKEFAAYVNSLR